MSRARELLSSNWGVPHLPPPHINGDADHPGDDTHTCVVGALGGDGTFTRMTSMWDLSPSPTNGHMPAPVPVGDHRPSVTQRRYVPDWHALHTSIAFTVRQAWAAEKIRTGVNNQLKRLEREGFDADLLEGVAPLLDNLETVEERYKAQAQRQMLQHPLAEWIKSQRGVGLLGVAYIIASTGPLENFANPAKVWKFLGMHVADGAAPRRARGQKAKWSQRGRVTCFQIGESIVKVGKGGPWREVYERRRETVLNRPRLGPSGCPFGHEHRGEERSVDDATGWRRKTGQPRVVACVKVGEGGKVTSAHVHADARRVAVKAFLKELWRQYQRVVPDDP